jgi:hypothetical protein
LPHPAETARWRNAEDLAEHAAEHGPELGLLSAAEYDASARETVRQGRRFLYQDRGTGRTRVGYFDPRSGRFTALSHDEATILTHFYTDRQYVRRLPSTTYR